MPCWFVTAGHTGTDLQDDFPLDPLLSGLGGIFTPVSLKKSCILGGTGEATVESRSCSQL